MRLIAFETFFEHAFEHANLDWKKYVEIDPRYFRPTEVNILQGDASKAERIFGWRPKVKFSELVKLMVDADIKLLDDQLEGHLVRQLSARD